MKKLIIIAIITTTLLISPAEQGINPNANAAAGCAHFCQINFGNCLNQCTLLGSNQSSLCTNNCHANFAQCMGRCN